MIRLLMLVVLLTGCGKIQDYELQRLSEICGGYDQLKQVWPDGRVPKAYCKDGNMVSAHEEVPV